MSQYAEYWQGIANTEERKRWYTAIKHVAGDAWVVSCYKGGLTNNIRSAHHYVFNDEASANKFLERLPRKKAKHGYR